MCAKHQPADETKALSATISDYITRLWVPEFSTISATAVVGLVAAIFAFPVYFLFVSSTLPQAEMFRFPPRLIPGDQLIENYRVAIFTTKSGLEWTSTEVSRVWLPRIVVNTLFLVIVVTVLTIGIATLAGYAFAKFEFTGKAPLFYTTMGMMAVPFQLLSIPLFDLLQRLSLLNTYLGFILPILVGPVALFFMKQVIEQNIVDSLIESARIDGASEFQIFYHIILPMVISPMAAITVLVFIGRINMLFWPLVVIQDPEKQVMSVYVANLIGAENQFTPWEILMPLSFLMVLPVVLMFILLQRHFVRGITGMYLKQ